MSLIFDIDLFQTDFEKYLKLSDLSYRLQSRLARIQGKNCNAFIGQELLAEQLNRHIKTIKKGLAPLEKFKLLEIERNKCTRNPPKYKTAKFLINYSDNHSYFVLHPEELIKILPKELLIEMKKNGFNEEEFIHRMKNNICKTYVTRSENVPGKGVTRSENVPGAERKRSRSESYPQPKYIEKKGEIEKTISPKGTIKGTIRLKREKNTLSKNSYCPGTYEQIISEEAEKIAKQKNIDIEKTAYKFMAYAQANGWLRKDWKAAFLKWLLDERTHIEHNISSEPCSAVNKMPFHESNWKYN